MENERRLAALEEKLELLTDALHQVSTEHAAQLAVQSFAIEGILRLTRPNNLFCKQLRMSVESFLLSNAEQPDQDFESRVLLQMNSLLAAAGEPPRMPEGD